MENKLGKIHVFQESSFHNCNQISLYKKNMEYKPVNVKDLLEKAMENDDEQVAWSQQEKHEINFALAKARYKTKRAQMANNRLGRAQVKYKMNKQQEGKEGNKHKTKK